MIRFFKRFIRKRAPPCHFYRKAKLKEKIQGTAGFCKLQNKPIYYEGAVGSIPFEVYEGRDGIGKDTCGVYKF
ncbi:MAG TPA: hypothetical protein VIO64_08885 [Pseudobacteroides sp.]|uniref:hypothetical protein n=1 Tax=Pseudobacteroides sp. TaxID=1968840 RepID=UPI002F940C18